MRNIFLLITFILFGIQLSKAQENIADTYINQIDGKLDKAKASIDHDCLDEIKSKNAETWYLKAYIYLEISKSVVYSNLSNNPAEVSLDAIKKCKQLDKENKFYSECLNVLFEISTIFYDKGITDYNSGIKNKNNNNFKEALKNFDLFFNAMDVLGNDEKIVKHLLEYNNINPNSIVVYAGFASQSIGNKSKAREYYQKLIDYNSDIPIARKNGLALAYIYYSDLLVAEGNNNEAIKVISRGIKLYPDNQDLIISNIDLFFQAEKVDELAEILEIAISNNPNNLQLLTILAGTYNKISKQYYVRGYQETSDKYRDKSIETYNLALKLTINDNELKFKLNYNCGLLYYNKGVKLYMLHDETNIEQWTNLFNSAIPYLTIAHNINSSETKLINILMKIYQCLNQTDKAKEMEEKLYK